MLIVSIAGIVLGILTIVRVGVIIKMWDNESFQNAMRMVRKDYIRKSYRVCLRVILGVIGLSMVLFSFFRKSDDILYLYVAGLAFIQLGLLLFQHPYNQGDSGSDGRKLEE